ncbi:MAG: class II fructose-1,6-bisphosphate aldolase [Firmicutes bacterium]|nr:class II fructose-1,6-bisphosphate aldolase [Bacillota bacterium]
MLQNMCKMLEAAKRGGYAVPHLNINNLEWVKYILEVCEESKSPIILGVSEGAAKYMGGYNTVVMMVKGLLKDLNITIPVALHLDHGSTFEVCKKAIDAGFTSVMIDASRFSIDENIRITREVVDYAKTKNVSVEAEIGHIGGTEDEISADIGYAKIEDCINLYQNTKIDFLAPALGSVHGLYKGEPKIDFDRMQQIGQTLKIPMVLHGGTGLPDDIIKRAISCGICKININTELQIEWAKGVREKLANDLNVYDPRKIISGGENNMKHAITDKIKLLGSYNKA